jgi:hypothetical protein
MTGAGITLYLLYLQSYTLAALTAAVFAPLIGFHFAIDKLSKDKAGWGQGRLIGHQNTSSSIESVLAQ